MRERVLDLVFLLGVLFKGLDGLVELVGGVVLLFVTPAKLQHAADRATSGELAEDPHDLIANLIVHGAAHLQHGSIVFAAVYLLVHGVVKVAIVIALLVGSRRIYPWAMAALGAFLIFQLYELVTHPSIGVAILTVFDAVIIWLTWREWRRGRELRTTWRGTVAWVFRRPVAD
ncbi:DUF2127 domain-containing protein [Leifsonia shinshuensis]|uniref:DUF2127 domain-containing protein n=1 Tax=Leifsonia shinshuensis TaxID=150026 RepID=UPI001F509572|nr:DUF2127 domain-containing protein [Leifsonia shinshuensis]MCI0159366.1 DUF2127 domain-containing protein [Leifsonia shinshuensis]